MVTNGNADTHTNTDIGITACQQQAAADYQDE
jgi:hypothetical protein